MRIAFLLLGLLSAHASHAQRLDPDQNPYWTRYTFVEDSSELVPLKGDYRVYYLQSGMWWNMTELGYPIRDLPAKSMRLSRLFDVTLPAFQATPARGTDLPEVRLVVVREPDTMVVELSHYWTLMGGSVDARCKTLDCTRRPPMILPFRPGRYRTNGRSFTDDASVWVDTVVRIDARTNDLIAQFDALWKEAMEEDLVVPQLSTDTCRQELNLLPDPDHMEQLPGDAWLLRSPYCGTHLVRFPSFGSTTDYTITFVPYLPEQTKEAVQIHVPMGDHEEFPVDVSDWPVGDHDVNVTMGVHHDAFKLKLR